MDELFIFLILITTFLLIMLVMTFIDEMIRYYRMAKASRKAAQRKSDLRAAADAWTPKIVKSERKWQDIDSERMKRR